MIASDKTPMGTVEQPVTRRADEVEVERQGPRFPASDVAIVAVVFATLLFKLVETVADADLWGHVRFGLDHLDTGRLARSDPYSYLSGGQEWINHEWLTEAILALAYRGLGGSGLVALKLVCAFALLGLVYRHLVRRGLTPLRAAILLLLGYLPASVGLGTVRPQLFTYLGFLLVLLVIEAADRGRWRWLWTLPLVFGAWVNLHGGFLAGVAVLGVWVIAQLSLSWRRGRSPDQPPPGVLMACLVGSLLATLVNPYGVGLWRFLLETALIPRPEITEWASVSPLTIDGALYLVMLAVTGVAIVRHASLRSAPLVAVYAVTAPLPIMALRHLPLFVLAALVVTAAPMAALWRGAAGGTTNRPRPRWFGVSLGATALVLLALSVTRFDGVVIDGERQPMPARAVGALEASGASGNLAVFFNWGEYAIWHLAPDFKVSWDGRRETVYPQKAHVMNLLFFFGTDDWDELLREHPTDLVLTPKTLPVYNLMKLKEPWELVYEDSLAAVFARSGSRHARAISAVALPALPPDGDGLRFP